MKMAFEVL